VLSGAFVSGAPLLTATVVELGAGVAVAVGVAVGTGVGVGVDWPGVGVGPVCCGVSVLDPPLHAANDAHANTKRIPVWNAFTR
jgi:hypothetical protein